MSSILTIPDCSASDLIALAHAKKRFSRRSNLVNFEGKGWWDFYQYRVGEDRDRMSLEVRGQRFKTLRWKPDRNVTSAEVREHFKALHADGNVAAFIVWVMEKKHVPGGEYISIPSDDRLLLRLDDGTLCAPAYERVRFGRRLTRELNFIRVDLEWPRDTYFLAFRELKSV